MPKGLKKHETVPLRRLQADAAVTLPVTKKQHDTVKRRKHPDYYPEPVKAEYSLEYTPADASSTCWSCKQHESEKNVPLGALKPEDKSLYQQMNPTERAERRQHILGTLVDFLTMTGLGGDM